MPRQRTRYPELAHPLSRAQALGRGIPPHVLDSRALEHPYWGVVQEFGEGDQDPLWRRCRQVAARMPAHQFFSHGTALRLHGAPAVGREPDALHVSAHRPFREPRRGGIAGHRLQERDDASTLTRGLRIESPARAWRQAAAGSDLASAVILGDFVVARRRPLATLDELWGELAALGGTRAMAQALGLVRVGSESPQETRLRLALNAARLPEPELNVDLFDAHGTFIARGDLVFPRWRVLVEYDGRQHAESAVQFARDADRWEALRDAGWDVVRVLNHHMGDGAAPAVERVRAALRRGGWSG